MFCYFALALLIGSALALGSRWVERGTSAGAVVVSVAAVLIAAILLYVRDVPTPGDIASSLTRNPDVYTLSLGHMKDLTPHSFAYLRLPLAVAGIAFLIGAIGCWRFTRHRAILSLALMMVVFFHAARMAMVVFDPYLSSRRLALPLLDSPEARLIVDDQYYAFSSIFFYANRRALLLNGRVQNLVYGSFAPGAPNVFIDDSEFQRRWTGGDKYHLVADGSALTRLEKLVGKDRLHVVVASGGKVLFRNTR